MKQGIKIAKKLNKDFRTNSYGELIEYIDPSKKVLDKHPHGKLAILTKQNERLFFRGIYLYAVLLGANQYNPDKERFQEIDEMWIDPVHNPIEEAIMSHEDILNALIQVVDKQEPISLHYIQQIIDNDGICALEYENNQAKLIEGKYLIHLKL